MIGIDYLGGANYGDVIMREHPAGYAAGFILNTNRPNWKRSNAWPVILELAKSGRCPLFKLHAMWDDDHAMRPQYQRIIMAELERAEVLARTPGVTVEFSWLCENNLTRAENSRWRDIVGEAKGVRPLNSIWNGDVVPACKHEVHGNHGPVSGAYNYSYDGDDCFQDNIVATRKRHANAEVFFLWSWRNNGMFSGKKEVKRPRNERTWWPFEAYLDAMIALTRLDSSGANLSNKYIYKAVAEDSGKDDGKNNKPCFIAPQKAKEVLFLCENGQVAGRLAYFGTFQGGGFRYYSEQWGYQIAEKAIRIQGHPIVTATINGKAIGKVCPSHRAGSFR